MRYYLVDYRMKKYFFILLFFLGCETFDLKTDNPLDPSNPDYELPMVSITLLNYISLDKIDITLQGNENVSEYGYTINSDDPFIDMNDDWVFSSSEIISLEFLNEYTYELLVKSRYPTGQESNVENVIFTVDAVLPSSLLLYPKSIKTDIFTNFSISLYAHELPNVSALDFIIEYDNTKMSWMANQGSKEYGDVNVVREPSSNQIHYTIGKYGENGFDQNALIAEIVFQMKDVSGSTSFIKILSPTAKSLDGQTIEIAGTNQTRVIVK
jgi:hypothetical protein